jgi:hypothetical protein
VPLFENGIVQVSTAVGSVSSLIWQPSNTSTTTFGSLGSVASGAVLKDVTILNTGTATIYVNSGSAAVGTTLGLQVPSGAQATVQGYNVTAGTAVTGNIWANTSGTGLTSSTTVGLATVASVV